MPRLVIVAKGLCLRDPQTGKLKGADDPRRNGLPWFYDDNLKAQTAILPGWERVEVEVQVTYPIAGGGDETKE